MKVIRIKIVPAILLLSIIITMFAVTKVFAANKAKVTTETLRVREEADTKSNIVMLLEEGNKVEVLEDNGEWYKIKSNGKVGYVKKEFIRLNSKNAIIQTANQNDEEKTEEQSIAVSKATELKNQITEGYTGNLMNAIDIKILPQINSNNIGIITQGEQIEVIEVINDWCRIQTEESIGWIRKNTLAKNTNSNNETENQNLEQEIAGVKEENNSSEIVSRIAEAKLSSRSATTTREKAAEVEQSVETTQETKTASKKTKTKKSTTTSKSAKTTTSIKKSETKSTTSSSAKGTEIVEYAKTLLGCKYVAGGTNPSKGFDCSGFTQYVFKHFGISLNRASTAQINNGKAVDKSDLQPGDILIFKNRANNAIGHVAIYIGNNQMIHAANSKTGVIIGKINDSYYGPRYVAARRLV